MQSILDIDGLRSGLTVDHLDLTHDGLLVALLLVTLRLQLNQASISVTGTNAAERTLVDLSQGGSNPRIVILVQGLRLALLEKLQLGEQNAIVLKDTDAILGMLQSIVLLGEDLDGLLQTTNIGLFGHSDNGLLVSMGQNIVLLNLFLVKYIVLHSRISSFIIIGIIIIGPTIFKGLPDYCINSVFLLFVKRVKHVSKGLFVFGLFILLDIFCHSRVLLFIFVCVR